MKYIFLFLTLLALLFSSCKKKDCVVTNVYYPLLAEDSAAFPYKGFEELRFQISDSNGNILDTLNLKGQGPNYDYHWQINENPQCEEEFGQSLRILYSSDSSSKFLVASLTRTKSLSIISYQFFNLGFSGTTAIFKPPFFYNSIDINGIAYHNVSRLCANNGGVYTKHCDKLNILVNMDTGILRFSPGFNEIYTLLP